MESKHPLRCIEWHTPPARVLQQIQTPSNEWKEDQSDMITEVEKRKEAIQPYDKTDTWDLAKRITNPYELIYTTSSRLALPKSTCCLQPLSRSFFKMIEMLQQLQFFDRHAQQKLKSLHICEGPGGFIEAFLHGCEYKKRQKPQVFGMTLKSTHTIIPGWRRATNFLQKHKTITLLSGPTKTGNIYEPCNQNACAEAVGINGAHLVTADGGFDFSEDFYAQEKSIFRLLVCSVIIILKSVAIEGDCVLKLFDCNSSATRDLLALLASCFQQWTLYKPVTSRPCNSEWYFLGKSAIRDRTKVIEILCLVRDRIEQSPIDRILEENPLEAVLKEVQEKRCKKQMEALDKVLSFCNMAHSVEEKDSLWVQQRKNTVDWCHEFHIPTVYR